MDYRSLVEDLEAIMSEDDSTEEVDVEIESSEELSPQVLLKEIVLSINGVIDALSSEEIEDYDEFLNKLKNVKETLDGLHKTAYTSSHQDDEVLDEEELPLSNIDGNEYGTKGMGPKIDSSGKQNYSNSKGTSYAERQGFVGP